ncbi:hypothetical protein Scep_019013 [Stephania cephalantha]|uniref:Uncharacterized protein n=1 Tax=Stephania cephalantha TaxID=152367 RepID=A0AAP0IA28_9MAGN
MDWSGKKTEYVNLGYIYVFQRDFGVETFIEGHDETESSERASAICRGSSQDFKDSIAIEHPIATVVPLECFLGLRLK